MAVVFDPKSATTCVFLVSCIVLVVYDIFRVKDTR